MPLLLVAMRLLLVARSIQRASPGPIQSFHLSKICYVSFVATACNPRMATSCQNPTYFEKLYYSILQPKYLTRKQHT